MKKVLPLLAIFWILFPLCGLAQLVQGEIDVSSNTLDFGSIAVGSSSSVVELIVINAGDAALTGFLIGVGGENPHDFSLTNSTLETGGALASVSEAAIGITFTPTATGTRLAYLIIAANSGGIQMFTNVTLSGNTGEAPEITCPADILANAPGGVCLPSISFAASVTGDPTPETTYQLGTNPILSPTTFPIGTNFVAVTAANSLGTNTCGFNVIVQSEAAPQLNLIQSGTKVILSWPVDYSCYTLQTASVLGSNNWQAYAGALGTNGGYFSVTNSVSTSNTFFRLAY